MEQNRIAELDLLQPKREGLWDLYKKAKASFWFDDEIDLGDDLTQWRAQVDEDEKACLLKVLAFFAKGDGPVAENLVVRFLKLFSDWTEAVCFYSLQLTIEVCTHAQMYQNLLMLYCSDDDDLLPKLMRANHDDEVVAAKNRWMMKWLDSEEASRSQLLVAFACVEGIFFSSSFCIIFWFNMKKVLRGLVASNRFISRDEGLHWNFACEMLTQLRKEHGENEQIIGDEEIAAIIKDCVQIEERFAAGILERPLVGINAPMMQQYVRFVADIVAVQLGIPKIYNETSPFEWMSFSEASVKDNFFEKRPTDYPRPRANKSIPELIKEHRGSSPNKKFFINRNYGETSSKSN